jgi:hypothetical protein
VFFRIDIRLPRSDGAVSGFEMMLLKNGQIKSSTYSLYFIGGVTAQIRNYLAFIWLSMHRDALERRT